uniref:MARVEL domain-containing protein n=1 Tax=Elaeophora elaphi TaxID=1147741 RepID=A0A158Q7B7_9BILA
MTTFFQACNVILIVVGLTAVGLAASQFSNVSLNNYRKIDLRLLNWIYVLAGLVGLYTLSRNHGIVVAKTIHCVSIAVAIYSTAFYCVTLFRIAHLHDASMHEQASLQNEFHYDDIRENFIAKLVICSLMILVPVVACLAAIVAAALLDRFVVVSQPTWSHYSHDQNKRYRSNRLGLTTLAAIKLFLALCALFLAIFLEYEHQLLSSKDPFVLIALDHIAALLAIVSATVDLHAAVINRQPVANYKVAIGISVIAAVWCLKSLDIEMYPYFYNDIQVWRGVNTVTRNINQTLPGSGTIDRTFVIIIVEGILVALFALLFGLNLLSAIQASKCIGYEYYNENTMIQKSLALQSRCLGLLHFIWAILLMALVVLGLIDVSWNANYIGADLMWLAILLFATGILYITHSSSKLSVHFVLGFVCFTCALEKMCSSINLTYQSATYPAFIYGSNDAYLGRMILNCMQLAVLFLETVTAFFSVIIFSGALRQQYRHTVKHSTCMHVILLLGNTFYGAVLIGCHILFTLGYWLFSESLVEIPFFQMGNGLLVFGISILQALSLCYPTLLLSVIILNVISASIALFMISYAISNTYFLAALLFTVEGFRWVIIEMALILTACATVACIICTFCSIFAIVGFLYTIVYRRPTSSTSTIMLCEDNNYGTLRTLVSPQLQTPPVRHMEEQSIYWSTDENPYYYQASKRYYDQPYRIDSGFYGYALCNPQIFVDSPYAVLGAGSSGRIDSGRYFRTVSSSAAQTRIGHIFS